MCLQILQNISDDNIGKMYEDASSFIIVFIFYLFKPGGNSVILSIPGFTLK